MNNNSSKDKILTRIKETKQIRDFGSVLSVYTDNEIYKPIEHDAVTCFKNELNVINGQCEIFETMESLFVYLKVLLAEKKVDNIFCKESVLYKLLTHNNIKLTQNQQDFEKMQAAVTTCEFLIARTGGVLVSSANESGRQLISFPPIHIVLAHASQLVNYPVDAYEALLKKYKKNIPSQITTITGPSRTSDIEKTLVLGAHGPKEFIVLLCNDKSFNNFAI